LPRGLREALTCFLQVLAIPVALAEPPPVQAGDIAPPAPTPAVVALAEPGQVVLVRVPGALALATALVFGVHGAKPPGAELALSVLTEYRYINSDCAAYCDLGIRRKPVLWGFPAGLALRIA
jgi:hypothetical protein